MSACPSDEVVARFLDGEIVGEAHGELRRHARGCAECRALMVEAVRNTVDLDAPLRFPGMPERAGRYQLHEAIGMGASGIVYAAFDPELSRRLAVKILRPRTERRREELRARFVREAKSLARVVHPNVVAVFDVGEVDDHVFIAMELVEGDTLREWMQRRDRPLAETLQLFAAAGEGLRAVHQAGLVHRDFKPENVLLGSDGRPRVTDFGLALASWDLHDSGPHDAPASGPLVSLTQTGALLGTPTYMSPEQLRAEPADAQSDVFAFCVALYEAIVGVRPFAGVTLEDLTRNITLQRFVGTNARLPRGASRVLPLVRRGLAVAPADRWATIEELLAALRKTQRPRAPRLRAAVLAGTACLVAAAIATPLLRRAEEKQRCQQNPYASVWNETRRQALTAIHAAPELASQIDRYATSLSTVRTERCEATYVSHGQSEAVFDAQSECLDQLAYGLGLAIEGLRKSPSFAAVTTIVPKLELPATCAKARPRNTRRTPEEKAAYEALRNRLLEARTNDMFGRSNDALVAYTAAAEAAQLAKEPALFAWALLGQGQEHYANNRLAQAGATYDRGVAAAFAAGDYGVALNGIAMQIQVESARERGLDLVERYASLARWTIGQGKLEPSQQAQFHRVLADAYISEQRTLDAEIELRTGLFFEDDRDEIAQYQLSLGNILRQRGDWDGAMQALQAARVAFVAAGNDRVPIVVATDNALALVEHKRGDDASSIARLEAVLARFGGAPEDKHPDVASIDTLMLLSQMHRTRGDRRQARSFLERAHRAGLVVLEPIDPFRWELDVWMARYHNEAGEPQRALVLLDPLAATYEEPGRSPTFERALFHVEMAAALLAGPKAKRQNERVAHHLEAARSSLATLLVDVDTILLERDLTALAARASR